MLGNTRRGAVERQRAGGRRQSQCIWKNTRLGQEAGHWAVIGAEARAGGRAEPTAGSTAEGRARKREGTVHWALGRVWKGGQRIGQRAGCGRTEGGWG
jgi:hypothetical protein